jgi:hypothetical protein
MCQVCDNPQRLEIDRKIAQGVANATIAREYNISEQIIGRHAQRHLSHQLAAAWDKKQLENSVDMLGMIDGILQRARQIFKRNYEAHKDMIALKALSEQRSTIELLAKISYAYHQAKVVELELARAKNQDESEARFKDRLHVLTNAELDMFEKLLNKIDRQAEGEIILADAPAHDFSMIPRFHRKERPSDIEQSNDEAAESRTEEVTVEEPPDPQAIDRTLFPPYSYDKPLH